MRETTPSAHPSPAQQVAAQGATRSFRSFVADAAVTVADDLATADQAAAAGNTSAAQAAAAAALLAYDQLRGQEGLVSTGADQAKLTDPNGEIDASSLLGQVLCDTGFGGCSKTSNYPKPTGVKLTTLPGNTLGSTTSSTLLANTSTTALPTMPNPCQGVPDSLWCSGGQLIPSN